MRIEQVLGVVAALLAACDSGTNLAPDGASTVDAAAPDATRYACWPPLDLEPRGTAELGAGANAFEAVGDELALEYGVSGGFLLTLRSRMTGVEPGNPRDILDPSNPFTRIRGYFVDTGLPLNRLSTCGARFAYQAAAASYFELQVPLQMPIDLCWDAHHLIGQRIRIELEVADASGGYATDSRIVTLAEPTTPYPIDAGAPGCEPP